VLISPRDFETPDTDDEAPATAVATAAGGSGLTAITTANRKGVWDIIDKAEQSDWRQIRKEDGIHKHLFGVTGETESADIFEKLPEEEINIDNI
jgi:hypothetical protein